MRGWPGYAPEGHPDLPEYAVSVITDWESGEPCERHDLAFCADCLALAKLRRDDTGVWYKSDCAVQTFMEITGATYEEAAAAFLASGFRPGHGTRRDVTRAVFESYGYTVTRMSYRFKLEDALRASRSGRAFYVGGTRGRKAHLWSVINGQQFRPMYPPFRYEIFEVTA